MTTRSLILCAGVLVSACGGAGESNEDAIAAAVSHVAKAPEEANAKVNATERLEALSAKAEASTARAKADAWAALINLPTEASSDLGGACSELSTAYDQFMTTRLAGSGLERWNATKQVDLERIAQRCRKLGKARVAACQTNALRDAGPLFVSDDAAFIVSKCEDLLTQNVKPSSVKAG